MSMRYLSVLWSLRTCLSSEIQKKNKQNFLNIHLCLHFLGGEAGVVLSYFLSWNMSQYLESTETCSDILSLG